MENLGQRQIYNRVEETLTKVNGVLNSVLQRKLEQWFGKLP